MGPRGYNWARNILYYIILYTHLEFPRPNEPRPLSAPAWASRPRRNSRPRCPNSEIAPKSKESRSYKVSWMNRRLFKCDWKTKSNTYFLKSDIVLNLNFVTIFSLDFPQIVTFIHWPCPRKAWSRRSPWGSSALSSRSRLGRPRPSRKTQNQGCTRRLCSEARVFPYFGSG